MSDCYQRQLLLAASVRQVTDFFMRGDAWFRLNPEWEVLEAQCAGQERQVKVRYERSEAEAAYRCVATRLDADGALVEFQGDPHRAIALSWSFAGEGLTRLEWRESFPSPLETARLAELNLWLDAVAGYLALAARTDRKARLARWLLDRFWLRMSPTARRVSLLIIGMEALALVLFIAVLVVDRVLGA